MATEQWPQKKHPIHRSMRRDILANAHNNVFELASSDVFIDLLTDSGTGRMSKAQWKALRYADESYAGSESAKDLKETIKNLFSVPHVLLVNQGRAAETVVFDVLLSQPGKYVLGNTPFDTTRYNIEERGGIVVDGTLQNASTILQDSAADPFDLFHPFLGIVDPSFLDRQVERIGAENVGFFLLTATCNSNSGQPVSMHNIRCVAEIAHAYKIPLFLDLARYAENAFFIKQREAKYRGTSVTEIVSDMASYADGFLISGKKDALGNMGGFIGLRSRELAEKIAQGIRKAYGLELVDGYGYGGMSGRDMAALAQGIRESTDEQYLAKRIGQIDMLARDLHNLGVPVLPPGGHAVFINAGEFLPHLAWNQFPGHALALALYLEGGIRSVEVGSLMLGRDPATGDNRQAPQELLRLAIPRRLYTDRQLAHVVKTFQRLVETKESIPGVTIDLKHEYEPRHFAARFMWEGM